jgi:hypothetical protein
MLATPVLYLVWVGLLLGIAVIDVGAYLVAAAHAQGAADAAALAAVGVEVEPGPVAPHQAAETTASRNDAELEACTCRSGGARAEVEVSVDVPGLLVPQIAGMQRVTAAAEAELAEPDGVPPDGAPPMPDRRFDEAPRR